MAQKQNINDTRMFLAPRCRQPLARLMLALVHMVLPRCQQAGAYWSLLTKERYLQHPWVLGPGSLCLTFSLHPHRKTLLIAAVLAAVALALVDQAVLVVAAGVGEVFPHRALEEAFAALAAVNPIMFTCGGMRLGLKGLTECLGCPQLPTLLSLTTKTTSSSKGLSQPCLGEAEVSQSHEQEPKSSGFALT